MSDSVSASQATQVYQGIAVGGGVVLGPLYRLWVGAAPGARRAGTPDAEAEAFAAALASAGRDIEALVAAQDRLAADILEFQLALLDDDDVTGPVYAAIAKGEAADVAWTAKMNREIADYRAAGDNVLAARSEDLCDLKARVLGKLGVGGQARHEDAPEGAILVTEELTPSQFLGIDWRRLGGAVTTGGSATSHVAILARARGVNLVVGTCLTMDTLPLGEEAILDAVAGRLTVNPDRRARAAAAAAAAVETTRRAAVEAILRQPARTADGMAVKVLANIDAPALLDELSAEICDGVGLVRTEFLFEGGRRPDEEAQLAFYRRLLAWAGERPVTIRTLDAGGDKPLAGITLDGEANPFLGLRGLRLSFLRPELFRQQLRALARAAAEGPVKVMLPMVTAPAELTQARAMLNEEFAALKRAGIPAARPALGIMVEVPAAALMAADFDADFYSIGSNDLIQYTAACARDNPAVAALADPRSPAVLELIARVVAAGRQRRVEVSLCGDMASQPDLVPLLLDCGVTVLSCAPAQIGAVKLAVSQHGSRERKAADDGE